jgi:hypothetical protein
MWRNWNTCTLLVGIQMFQLVDKTIWQFLNELNTELSYDLAIQRYILKEIANRYWSKYICAHVHKSTTHNSQKVKTAQMFMNREWVNKL